MNASKIWNVLKRDAPLFPVASPFDLHSIYSVPKHVSVFLDEKRPGCLERITRAFYALDKKMEGLVGASDVSKLLTDAQEEDLGEAILKVMGINAIYQDGSLQWKTFLDEVYHKYVNLEPKRTGTKRCTLDTYPLPHKCMNNACTAHIVHPLESEAIALKTPQLQSHHNTLHLAFKRHAKIETGGVNFEEIRSLLREAKIHICTRNLEEAFSRYDIDGSGVLDFEEFVELLKDLKADHDLVRSHQDTYSVSELLKTSFSQEEMEEIKFQFGIFDIDGSGSIDEAELSQILESFNYRTSPQEVRELIADIDSDDSNTVSFSEFVYLMQKIKTGQVTMGAQIFAQVVSNSGVALRLANEVRILQGKEWLPGCTAKLESGCPPVAHIHIVAPKGSPYEGKTYTIEVIPEDDYPYTPPMVVIKPALLHVNFPATLNGVSSARQVTQFWDCSWGLEKLAIEIHNLMKAPNVNFLPGKAHLLLKDNLSAEESIDRHDVASSWTNIEDLRPKSKSDYFLVQTVEMLAEDRELFEETAKNFGQLDENGWPVHLRKQEGNIDVDLEIELDVDHIAETDI